MILSPRLQSLLPRILLKRKPYMVNLRQQRLLLSGMLLRLARMLLLLAQTPPPPV